MKAIVVKPFNLSVDGINSVALIVGEQIEVPADLVNGLVSSGFINLPDGGGVVEEIQPVGAQEGGASRVAEEEMLVTEPTPSAVPTSPRRRR